MLHSLLSYAVLVIYLQRSCIQGLSSPAAATDSRTDDEHEVEVIMLASENNVPLALLSRNSGPVRSLIISSIIGFLTASSFVRVLCRWTTMQTLHLPNRRLLLPLVRPPLPARFLNFLALLLSPLNLKHSRLR